MPRSSRLPVPLPDRTYFPEWPWYTPPLSDFLHHQSISGDCQTTTDWLYHIQWPQQRYLWCSWEWVPWIFIDLRYPTTAAWLSCLQEKYFVRWNQYQWLVALNKTDGYMLVAIENVVDESVDDRWFAHCLVAQKYDLVLQEGRNAAFAEVEIAYIRHGMGSLKV